MEFEDQYIGKSLTNFSILLQKEYNSFSNPFNVYQPQDLIHQFPLHVAARNGDLNSMQYLIDNGINVNEVDFYNSTPLHIAALYNQVEAINLLINHNANIDALGYKDAEQTYYTPFTIAINELNVDTVKYFVENTDITYTNGVIYDLCNKIGDYLDDISTITQFEAVLETILILTQNNQAANLFKVNASNSTEIVPIVNFLYNVMHYTTNRTQIDLLSKYADLINEFDNSANIYTSAKILFHVLSIAGEYNIQYDNNIVKSLNAEGSTPFYTTPIVHDLINKYLHSILINEDSVKHRAFSNIEPILETAIFTTKYYNLIDTSELLYEKFIQGEPIMLPSGWNGHYVNIILDPTHNFLIVSNAGNRYYKLESGANIYKINNLENIDHNLLYDIMNEKNQYFLEYKLNYLLELEQYNYIESPNQTAGNCTWQSHFPAIEALLYLNLLDQNQNEHEALINAHKYFINWQDFETYTYLQEYLTNDPRIDIFTLEQILVEKHPTLFESFEGPINNNELHQAKLIIDAFASEKYNNDFEKIEANFENAKFELKSLFYEAGLYINDSDIVDSLDINDIINDIEDFINNDTISFDNVSYVTSYYPPNLENDLIDFHNNYNEF